MIKHLAIQMDGNRRWAQKNKLNTFLGHYHGVDAAQNAIKFCLEKKIPFLSLWALSIENYFKRSKSELDYLFNLLITKTEENLEKYIKEKVKVKFIGDRTLFPNFVIPTIEKIEGETKNFERMQLNILFCYAGKQEIVAGLKNIVSKVLKNEILIESINEQNFNDFLWLAGVPDPDIIIKTGGNQRLSNFMLFQCAYSELFFLDTF